MSPCDHKIQQESGVNLAHCPASFHDCPMARNISCKQYCCTLKRRPLCLSKPPMKNSSAALVWFVRSYIGVAAVFLLCAPGLMKAADRNRSRVNHYGAPVMDAEGRKINYDRKSLERMARAQANSADVRLRRVPRRTGSTSPTPRPRPTPPPRPTPMPPAVGPHPFWQYAVFGGNIGSSNIVIGPTSPNSPPEIIIGGYAYSGFVKLPNGYSTDNFWQVIRYNAVTGNYDQVFVSPMYQPVNGNPFVDIVRIGVAHVTSPSNWQIVVMIAPTKSESGERV